MKALTVRQPYANMILRGDKEEEYRTWNTSYRGRLLIVSARANCEQGSEPPYGVAICTVLLVSVSYHNGVYVWRLSDPKPVPNVPIRGRQGLYEVGGRTTVVDAPITGSVDIVA